MTIEARAQIPPATTPTTLVGWAKVMVRIRKNAKSLTAAGAGSVRRGLRQAQQPGRGAVRRLPQHAHQHEFAAGSLCAGLSAVASCLPAGSRAGASGDRSKCRAAVLAFRPAGAEALHARLFRRLNPIGAVQFSNTNPLQFWVTDGVQGMTRAARTTGIRRLSPGRASSPRRKRWRSGSSTLRSAAWKATRTARRIRGGAVHRSIGTAAKDPLFFLLHCNVDRLWAKWQRQNGRFDSAQADSFASNPSNPIGHNLAIRCGHGTG